MTTTNATDPLLGRVVDDRYRITRKLARGGMATVYLADDLRLTRTVAIKVMHDNLGADEAFVARFDREARAAARLSHPNVVAVFDQGMDEGRPYIVMEYVEGSTLRQVMTRESPMTPQRAIELLIGVAAAVAAAHEAGIIHRDLKPENVLISGRGQLKVADFGLARAVTAHTATAAGMLIGTVSYIAPELVTHGHADTRCDVYALGVVLYEMLTGRKPHTGETPIQVAYSHVHNEISAPSAEAPPQWRGTPSAIPDYVDALVLTAAARQPAERPRDAKVLLAHLQSARDAIAAGVRSDAALVARMRQTVLDEAEQATEQVPMLPALSPVAQMQATATLRFTPATPMSPEQPAAADGMAYYDADWPTPSPSAGPLIQRRERSRRRGRVSLALVLVLSVILGVGAWYLLAGRFTTTPDFTNLTQDQAQQLATKTGFPLVFDAAFSETVPVGQVTRTDPAKGDQISWGSAITAFLSKGPERYAVPSLAGRTVDEASAALKDAHLVLGKVSEVWDENVVVGKVVSASIEAGKLAKPNTVVNLTVSKGPAPVPIVSFVNKPFADAKAHYEAAGLKVAISAEKFSTKVPIGQVISQDPAKGSLPKNATVNFVVSKGPELIAVPNVAGMDPASAKSELTKAGFKVKFKEMFWARRVWSTDPGIGQRIPKGSTVTVTLA